MLRLFHWAFSGYLQTTALKYARMCFARVFREYVLFIRKVIKGPLQYNNFIELACSARIREKLAGSVHKAWFSLATQAQAQA